MTVASTGVVDEEDEDCDYTVHWGAGHQGPAEAGTVPLGLVAAPVPATAGNSDFVPAESEQESPLSQPPVLQCPDCGKVKQTQKQLRDHLRVHRKRVCEHCGQVLSVTTNMKSHIRRCQKDNVFQCNICNYKCPRQFDLDRHMNTHRVAPYKGYPCEKCDYVSTTKKDLRKHNREHPKYPCPKCGMKFYKKDTLDRHIQFHSDMVVETSDGHWFKLDSSQVKQRHKEKIYRCLLCSYSSRYKFNLNAHKKRIHERLEKPVKSDAPTQCKRLCGYVTLNPYNLRRHERTCDFDGPSVITLEDTINMVCRTGASFNDIDYITRLIRSRCGPRSVEPNIVRKITKMLRSLSVWFSDEFVVLQDRHGKDVTTCVSRIRFLKEFREWVAQGRGITNPVFSYSMDSGAGKFVIVLNIHDEAVLSQPQ